MANYYFSPIGDLTKEKILDDYDNGGYRVPHSYNTHGYGKIDWNLGNDQHYPIYSMTDGIISSITCATKDGEEGYVVCIVTDRKDKNGWPIVINYLELDGLAGKVAETMGIEESEDAYTRGEASGKRVSCYDDKIEIKMGEQIGFSNTRYSGSNVHIDFTYNDRYNGSYTPPNGAPGYDGENSNSTPQVSDDNDFFSKNKDSLFKGKEKVWNNGDDGDRWNINPYIAYLVMCQKPAYLSGSSSAGANYEDVQTLLDKATEWKNSHSTAGARVWKKVGSKEAINRARVMFNAFYSKFDAVQAAAIAANALSENVCNCLSNISSDGKTYTSTWGFGTDGINSETDGGWFAFHPWKDKQSTLKSILKGLGISDSCLNSESGGTAEVQLAIYNEIFSQSSIGKAYGLSKRTLGSGYTRSNGDAFENVEEGIANFVSGGLQTYTGGWPSECAAIFERGFEGSNLSVGDPQARFWSADCLYEIFTGNTLS